MLRDYTIYYPVAYTPTALKFTNEDFKKSRFLRRKEIMADFNKFVRYMYNTLTKEFKEL
jgi:hypothetical protein